MGVLCVGRCVCVYCVSDDVCGCTVCRTARVCVDILCVGRCVWVGVLCVGWCVCGCAVCRTGGTLRRLPTITGRGTSLFMTGCTHTSTKTFALYVTLRLSQLLALGSRKDVL